MDKPWYLHIHKSEKQKALNYLLIPAMGTE